MSNTPSLLAASLATAFGSFATLTCVADPRPAGAKVVAGQVSISHPTPTSLHVQQRSAKAAIEHHARIASDVEALPVVIDMPAPGTLANGLNLAADKVFIRGLVFVLDGAVSIQGATRLVIGNSIRSANGYAMSIGGGEINLYRPTWPDGTEYKNTDIIVAQYAGGTLKYYEQLNGTWQESTSFVSVVMPADLPLALADRPAYWIDRTNPGTAASAVFAANPAFRVEGVELRQLLSLPNQIPSTFSNALSGGLASYDFADGGMNPDVPLLRTDGTQLTTAHRPAAPLPPSPPAPPRPSPNNFGDMPGTHFVPKILITNDPGPGYPPPTQAVASGGFITQIGRIALNGPIFETNRFGVHQVGDADGGFNSGGDLRNVALKIVSFDTRALFQDSRVAKGFPGSFCGLAGPIFCLDDPQFPVSDTLGPYPRKVYPNSETEPRKSNGFTSKGFQAASYLVTNCLTDCVRPTTTDYVAGEQSKPGMNPNAPTTSLTWSGVQPGPASAGQFESFGAFFGLGFNLHKPALAYAAEEVGRAYSYILYGVNVSLTQSSLLRQAGAAGVNSRIVMAMSHGVLTGEVSSAVDSTSLNKTTLPQFANSSPTLGGAPSFPTISPTLLHVDVGRPSLSVDTGLPALAVFVSMQSPVDPPDQSTSNNLVPTDEATLEVDTLLVLGGRGLAQNVDLGRSGGLGPTPSASTAVTYEVACTVDAPAPPARTGKRSAARHDTTLPPCR